MKLNVKSLLLISFAFLMLGCAQNTSVRNDVDRTAAEILGNPDYLAISYGGYRQNTREVVPSVGELKDDMKILAAMGIKLLRTYNTQQFGHAANLLEAIKQLKDADPTFEMYVMLGTWIECDGAWTASPNHRVGNVENNTAEIEMAIKMAKAYPDIVKIIAVGNEAMVQWAISYYVYPNVILQWVNFLKEVRAKNEIPSGVWITSSDNYESWGGGATNYQTDELKALIEAVDFISLHTYPFHDSHYNPAFWGVPEEEENQTKLEQIDAAMLRAKNYAIAQYQGVVDYLAQLGIDKPIHIGETGWATKAASSYGATGSRAADEYKEKLYYDHMRDWTNEAQMSCFYFEAFDEQWKDAGNALGSENHFGLINLKGEAKYPLWEMVDEGLFDGLTRNGVSITKTYGGIKDSLLNKLLTPPSTREMGLLKITTVNETRKAGEPVTEGTYLIVHDNLAPDHTKAHSYPSANLKLNAWEGTCGIEMSQDGIIEVTSGTGDWWGCALEIEGGVGENLSPFKPGKLHFMIKGNTTSSFQLGFQTGSFAEGTQTNNFITFGENGPYTLTKDWRSYSIELSLLEQGANLTDVTAPLFLRGDTDFDGEDIRIKNIYYSQQ